GRAQLGVQLPALALGHQLEERRDIGRVRAPLDAEDVARIQRGRGVGRDEVTLVAGRAEEAERDRRRGKRGGRGHHRPSESLLNIFSGLSFAARFAYVITVRW